MKFQVPLRWRNSLISERLSASQETLWTSKLIHSWLHFNHGSELFLCMLDDRGVPSCLRIKVTVGWNINISGVCSSALHSDWTSWEHSVDITSHSSAWQQWNVDHVEVWLAGYCSLQLEGFCLPKGCLQDTHFFSNECSYDWKEALTQSCVWVLSHILKRSRATYEGLDFYPLESNVEKY
jgi:hypothetical protein